MESPICKKNITKVTSINPTYNFIVFNKYVQYQPIGNKPTVQCEINPRDQMSH